MIIMQGTRTFSVLIIFLVAFYAANFASSSAFFLASCAFFSAASYLNNESNSMGIEYVNMNVMIK